MVPPATVRAIFGDPDDPLSTLAAPAVNRATQGLYPTGSTFKPITALAALDSGALELAETITDGGSVDVRRRRVRERRRGRPRRRRPAAGAPGLLRRLLLHPRRARPTCRRATAGAIQDWARALGLGAPTGLDVGRRGARAGCRRPSGATRPTRRTPTRTRPAARRSCIEEGELTDRPWSIGDNVNLAVGQGDLQANPLQMAVAYAAIANGGRDRAPARRAARSRTRRAARSRRSSRRRGARSRSTRPGSGRSSTACTTRRWRRAAPPTRSSAATRSRSPARPEPPSARRTRDQSWYVALAPYDDPQVRRRGDDRGGRLRRRRRGARRRCEILNELLDVKPAKIDDVAAERRGGRVMEAFPRPRPFEQPRATLIERTGFAQPRPVLLVAGARR